jgi:Na+-driven multidrug efflux pump
VGFADVYVAGFISPEVQAAVGFVSLLYFFVIIAMWVIRLPLVYGLALPLGFGAPGVWWSMVASVICQSFFMAGRFHAGKWKHLKLE